MYLIKGELTEELQSRYQIRENEIARILWNIEEAFTFKHVIIFSAFVTVSAITVPLFALPKLELGGLQEEEDYY